MGRDRKNDREKRRKKEEKRGRIGIGKYKKRGKRKGEGIKKKKGDYS
jgi:hypothetical protein